MNPDGRLPRPALPNLTSLRFVAAFSVFFHHLDAVGVHASRYVWNVNLGWTVSFFFVLSGFVLAYSYEGRLQSAREIGKYGVLRVARLWPVHVACLILLLVLVEGSGATALQTYLVLSLQQAWVPAYGTAFALNAVAWSISVELFFYLLLPGLLLLPKRLFMASWAVALAGVGATIWALEHFGGPVFPDPVSNPNWATSYEVTPSSLLLFFPPIRLIEFMAGIATLYAFRSWNVSRRWVPLTQGLTFALVIAYMTQHALIVGWVQSSLGDSASQAYRQFGAFPLFALIVFVFAHHAGILTDFLSARPLVYLGETSFSFYMVHQIAIRFAATETDAQSYSGIFIVGTLLLLSLALAFLLHFCIERPMMRFAKGWFAPNPKEFDRLQPRKGVATSATSPRSPA